MKKVKNWLVGKKIGLTALNALALMAAVMSVNSACLWFHHQPEVPTDLKKYRRF